MGPNARYFRLTPEEEAMVEELLQQRDPVEDDTDNNSIMSSHISTAFDVEGDEAVLLAEIECKLDPYKESHSFFSASPMASASSKTFHGCGSSPMASASTPTNKPFDVKGESVTSENNSGEYSSYHEAISKALEPFATTTTVEDYLVELKERREYEAKLEEIDKKLRQLQKAEMPANISEEQLLQLIHDSKKEQELHAALQ